MPCHLSVSRAPLGPGVLFLSPLFLMNIGGQSFVKIGKSDPPYIKTFAGLVPDGNMGVTHVASMMDTTKAGSMRDGPSAILQQVGTRAYQGEMAKS